MITKQTKLLIFDMDGLLIDSERVYKEGWQFGLAKENLHLQEEILDSWTGKSMHETDAHLMRLCNDTTTCDRIRTHREAYIYRCLQQGTLMAKPYAAQALQCARSHGFVIGLATSTNKKRSVAILTKLGLMPYLQYPIFADDVRKLKPNPDVYLAVLRTAGFSAQEAVAFEDSLTGYTAARAAGIRTALIPDQSFAPFDSGVSIALPTYADLSIVLTWISNL